MHRPKVATVPAFITPKIPRAERNERHEGVLKKGSAAQQRVSGEEIAACKF